MIKRNSFLKYIIGKVTLTLSKGWRATMVVLAVLVLYLIVWWTKMLLTAMAKRVKKRLLKTLYLLSLMKNNA